MTRAHAPLARHLSRFSIIQAPSTTADAGEPAGAAANAPDAPTPANDGPTLEARLEAARAEVRVALEAEASADRARLVAAHAEAVTRAAVLARAESIERVGVAVAAQIAAALATLRDDLATQVTDALRPLFADALAGRVAAAVAGALERALADPAGGGGLVVRGPAALLEAIGAGLPADVALTFVPDDAAADVSVTGRDVCIRSRLAEALETLSAGEGA